MISGTNKKHSIGELMEQAWSNKSFDADQERHSHTIPCEGVKKYGSPSLNAALTSIISDLSLVGLLSDNRPGTFLLCQIWMSLSRRGPRCS